MKEVSVSGKKIQKSLGAKSPKTELIFERFTQQKEQAQERLKKLTERLKEQKRVNMALRLGQTPSIVADVINTLEKHGLDRKIQVIGTNAMYAYGAAAGIVFDQDLMETEDVDLLWDSRSKMTLACPDPQGLLGILKSVDSSFAQLPDQGYTIANNDGYQIDLIKRHEGYVIDEPNKLWQNEDDFWAVTIRNMDWMLSSPRFSQIIIAQNGAMATMHTVDPRAFMLFKFWVSEQDNRDPRKAARDYRQAQVMQQLINDRFPHLAVDKLDPFPVAIRSKWSDRYTDK